jgi:RNase P subunit RPR2
MTFIQKLIISILPEQWSADIRAETKSWVLTCPNCGAVQSVWDLGGVRFKAASVGKSVLTKCAQCGQRHMMPMERKGK